MKVYPANTGIYLNGPTCHLELFSAEYDYKAYRRYYLKVLIPSSSLSYLPGESSISLYCFSPSLGCPSVISYDVVLKSCFFPLLPKLRLFGCHFETIICSSQLAWARDLSIAQKPTYWSALPRLTLLTP